MESRLALRYLRADSMGSTRLLIDRTRILLYGVAPLVVVATLIAMYFSDVPWMHEFAAPDHQREYGAVENVQNLILIAMIILALRTGRRESDRRIRLAWLGVALFTLLVLMEEIDWGNNYYRSFAGQPQRWDRTFNVHNHGATTYWIKFIVDTALIVGFGVLPVLMRFLPRTLRRLRPWTPSIYSILTLLVMVGAGGVAHRLEDAAGEHHGSLLHNISEFREISVYWLAYLYLHELRIRSQLPSSVPSSAPQQRGSS